MTVKILVKAPVGPGVIVNQAKVQGSQPDPVVTNNTATVRTTVILHP